MMIFFILVQIIIYVPLLIYVVNKVKNGTGDSGELKIALQQTQEELQNEKVNTGRLIGVNEQLELKISERDKKITEYENIIANKDEENIRLRSNNSFLRGDNENFKRELENKKDIEQKIQVLEVENGTLKAKIAEKDNNIKQLADSQEQIKNQFKVISAEIIKEQKETFGKEQKESLGNLLNPLNKDLKDLNEKLQKAEENNAKSTTSIETNIKNLLERANEVGQKADNLATALKGDKKMQGCWGEQQLQNLLELTGLEEGTDFEKQYNIKNKDGKDFFLDFMIRLPKNKILIADSKVSMVNYNNYINANDELEKQQYFKKYCDDLKGHIAELGNKDYTSVYKEYFKNNSEMDVLDIVFMFVAPESAYIDAIKQDKSIFNLATQYKIAIVTASSFMPVLRMIQHLWNIENQNRNITTIINLAKRLYDKVDKFAGSLSNVGKYIEKANDSYNDVVKYISTGNGNILSTAQKIINITDKDKAKNNKLAIEYEDTGYNTEDIKQIEEDNKEEN